MNDAKVVIGAKRSMVAYNVIAILKELSIMFAKPQLVNVYAKNGSLDITVMNARY